MQEGARPPLNRAAAPVQVLAGYGSVATFRRARAFSELSAQEKETFNKLRSEFWNTADADRRQAILDEIGGSYYGHDLMAMASDILARHDEAESLSVIALLTGNTSPDILPALEIALADPSRRVRREAVQAVDQVRDDAVVDFLGKAFEDSDADVRLSGFNVIDDQPGERRIRILGRALEASRADVQTMAVDNLQIESSPKGVDALLSALDSPSAELREAARFSLEFQLDQRFPNAAAARAWWSANRSKFDQDLAPK